jgi:murein DD-endopeptidase MepM/ murein hydrolase activator NlpD
MMAWNQHIFRVAVSCLLVSLLSGCLYDSYLPRIKQSRNYSVPTVTHKTASAAVVMPADFSPYYQELSYRYVTINRGDTVSRLAARHNVPLKSVIALNRMRSPYTIHPGQQLKIPAFRSHAVRPGETLYAISRVYNLEMSEVAHFNFLQAPYTLMPGSKLQIPLKQREEIRVASASMTEWPQPTQAAIRTQPAGPVKKITVNSLPEIVAVPKSEVVATIAKAPASTTVTPTPVAVKVAPAPATAPNQEAFQVAKLDIPPVPRRRYSIKEPPARSGNAFSWPVKGKVISGFGKKNTGFHNDGINISAKPGTPVRASENGVVSYVGNEMRSFGNLLLVSHAGGYVTAYGHTDKAAVSKGEAVKKGDIIAYVGASGNVTESQLHFEIRKKGRALNPTPLLK